MRARELIASVPDAYEDNAGLRGPFDLLVRNVRRRVRRARQSLLGRHFWVQING